MASRRTRIESEAPDNHDRMWSLDLSLVATSGLILYLISTQLSFDDPRLLFNGWTYVILIPLVAFGLAIFLRELVSRYAHKSIQLGFLCSVCIHLLLLILAFNVVIFSSFTPQASKNPKKKRRTPARRTVPEHLFQAPTETVETPDWSRPVEARTTSRVVPRDQRQLPPVDRSAPKLEMPKPRKVQRDRPMKKMLMLREEFTPAKPMPSSTPGKLARRESQSERPKPVTRPIEVPSLSSKSAQQNETNPSERNVSQKRSRSASSRRAPASPNMAAMTPSLSPQPLERMPATSARSQSRSMPRIGDSGATRQSRQRPRQSRQTPAGAAPATPMVSIAKLTPDAPRAMSRADTPVTRNGRTTGAQLAAGNRSGMASPTSETSNVSGSDYARSTMAAAAGVPNVRDGSAERTPGRTRNNRGGAGFSPAGAPTAQDALAASSTGTTGSNQSDQVEDRMGIMDLIRQENAQGRSGSSSPKIPSPAGDGMALDVMADFGPIGLANEFSPTPGVAISDDQPEVAAFDLAREQRQRRKVGGPEAPVGAKVAAVESFSRRVMRTRGGAAPDVAGFSGPATEEAIELGLAYLASTQRPDGSWSLQGHGDDVALRSDTAATGLCLLAFQGAGYTHMQHQYADTVSRGLEFLINNQRSSGNLFRAEGNERNDHSVAMYSHGIAALALSESFGMTQDKRLEESAQAALDYIVKTQHRKLGAWRYTPQVSADTSVTGWMMMALKSGELSGLKIPPETYKGINQWLDYAQDPDRPDRYRYDPFAPDNYKQRHGRKPSPTMTAVGMLMRMYSGWRRDNPAMVSAADFLLEYPPRLGTQGWTKRDGYYWYYATQVMFHMGGNHWRRWNQHLNPLLLRGQIKDGPKAGSWDPQNPVPDRWAPHAGRLYVTTMNLLNLEVYYRHLPIYEETAE